MKKKYFKEKIVEGVTSSVTISWIWFNRMNQILEGTTKANDTPNGLDNGYVHVGSSQAPTIEKYLPNDDIGPSQVGSVPPQNPTSIILAFGIFVDTSSMGIRGNIAIELPHTHVANVLGVFGKVVGNKRRKLSGDMESTFKELIES
jgi:hypothetical protein